MKRAWMIVALALAPASVRAAGAPAGVEPRADALVRRMSDEMANMKSFRVETDAADEVVLKSGQKLQQLTQSSVAVKRPNRLRSERVGPIADVVFRYDGDELSIFGKRTGMYATAKAPPTLDETIDYSRDELGLEAPGADLLFSRPYAVLMENVSSG